jgi:hypothetical protein
LHDDDEEYKATIKINMVTKRKQEISTREGTLMREDAGGEDERAYLYLATRDEQEMPHEEDDKVKREDRENFNEEQKGDDVEGAENKAEGREEDEYDDNDKEQRPSNQH